MRDYITTVRSFYFGIIIALCIFEYYTAVAQYLLIHVRKNVLAPYSNRTRVGIGCSQENNTLHTYVRAQWHYKNVYNWYIYTRRYIMYYLYILFRLHPTVGNNRN